MIPGSEDSLTRRRNPGHAVGSRDVYHGLLCRLDPERVIPGLVDAEDLHDDVGDASIVEAGEADLPGTGHL